MLWSHNSYVETNLDDIDVVMSVGICDHEKYPDRPQHVIVSVKLFQRMKKIKAQTIDDCIDYSKIRDFIAGWATRPHVDLIETLAEDLFDKCFQDSRVDACWLSIQKPDIIYDAKSVGIRAYRTREDHLNDT